MGARDSYRQLPGVDALVQGMPAEIERWGHDQVVDACRAILDVLRERISAGEQPALDLEAIREQLWMDLEARNSASLKPVINLTGTVLHTNLGRASLPPEAIEAVLMAAARPCNLEFDLDSGARGDRESHIEALVCELTGAEAATAVNNNAAAVLLVLNTLAMNKEVPVSRGELVEIGGSFRIPEVMQRANCTLVEVGATNRTHLKDYEKAISADTALLMKVHTSNYRVEGFTAEVTEVELAQLARDKGIPFVIDLGSGSLVDFTSLGLPAEPTARQAMEAGADLISFSGDKLLGGPQSGLIAGRRELVEQIRSNPLKRALRLDKMTLAALAEVLKLYRNPEALIGKLPTLRYLTRSGDDIRKQAEGLLAPVTDALGDVFGVEVVDCNSQIGSGALPVETLPGAALRLVPHDGEDATLRALSGSLRRLPLPVIGRMTNGALWLDLRCLEDEAAFLEQLEMLAP